MKKRFRIALAGNPNCGKTCIFNALTGARQHVGNYPGVTVESKSGRFELNGMEIEIIDLPGVYSLSSSSPEEEVVFEELTKTEPPEAEDPSVRDRLRQRDLKSGGTGLRSGVCPGDGA